MASHKRSKKKPASRASKLGAKSNPQRQDAQSGAPEPPAFGRLITSANAIFEQAVSLGARSQAIGDRLFFPFESKPTGETLHPVGAVATLALTLDEISNHLAFLSEQIARLETLA